jgi:hypothetical protein
MHLLFRIIPLIQLASNGSEAVEEEKKVNLYCLILKILLNFFNIFYQICVSEHFPYYTIDSVKRNVLSSMFKSVLGTEINTPCVFRIYADIQG